MNDVRCFYAGANTNDYGIVGDDGYCGDGVQCPSCDAEIFFDEPDDICPCCGNLITAEDED